MTDSVRIIFTDLDGTLLNSSRNISKANLICLEQLGKKKIVRVIATGRSFYSFRKLCTQPIPADYLIFSTGAGIINLHTGKLLFSANIEGDDIQAIASYLQSEEVDFMVHHKVPDNHHFTYWGDPRTNSDFGRRIELYRDYARGFTTPENLPKLSAQIIAIFPGNLDHFERIRIHLENFQITRTTSPLDGRSIWMEIQPRQISKGTSAAWLCNHLGLCHTLSLGIGNDYNDISLLQYTHHSYVVANAPEDMLQAYRTTRSNNDDGFSHAAREALLLPKYH